MAKLRLTLASILLLLLGLARGYGGLALVQHGASAVGSDRISDRAATLLGMGLLVLAFGALVASVGIMRRRVWGWRLGMIVPVAFVLAGALNGYLLFGQPGGRGTLINAAAAALIIYCLWVVRATHRGRYRGGRA
jgi:hypothetical protein